MKLVRVKAVDASYSKLVRLARSCGFIVKVGRRKHCRVETVKGDFITTIPRHNKIKRETARGIVKRMKEMGCVKEIEIL